MARTRGCNGKVKAGAGPALVGEVREWEFEETAERIDGSSIGSCTKTFEVGAVETTGRVLAWWDTDDSGQDQLIAIGTTVALELLPEGDTTGDVRYHGNVVVDSIRRSGGVDGLVEIEFSFSVQGQLTEGTEP